MRRNDTTDSKRKQRSKLVLSKQTIRELNAVELGAGGGNARDDLEPELPASDEFRCC